MDPYEKLANAIILLAVKDYRRALKLEQQHLQDHSEKRKLERLFRSDLFSALTKVDPELLIRKLNEEVVR